MSIKNRDYQVYEIFEELEKLSNFENKVEFLKTKFSDHTPLHRILKMNFCKTIISVFPSGEPPFNKTETDGPERASLWSYVKHFPIFVRSGKSANMNSLQREKIFIEMLEAVESKEAELICLAKDGKIETVYPSVTLELAQSAFPELKIEEKNG